MLEPIECEDLPTSPYPCLILDVGIYFRDRVLMKKLGRNAIKRIPWHTPMISALAYRAWDDPDRFGDLCLEFCRPSDAQIAVIDEAERKAKRVFDREILFEKLARSSGLLMEDFLNCARPHPNVLHAFLAAADRCTTIVSHNLSADFTFLAVEVTRNGMTAALNRLRSKQMFCTMRNGMQYCNTKLPGQRPRWPKLYELERDLFGVASWKEPYDIEGDLEAAEACYHELIRRGLQASN